MRECLVVHLEEIKCDVNSFHIKIKKIKNEYIFEMILAKSIFYWVI